MRHMVQFQFQVEVGGDDDFDEYRARELGISIAKSTFGEILFQELTDPDVFTV